MELVYYVHVLEWRDEDVAQRDNLFQECQQVRFSGVETSLVKITDIFMLQMLEQLQLPVGPLGQDRCTERLHDLLDSDILVRELVLGRAV